MKPQGAEQPGAQRESLAELLERDLAAWLLAKAVIEAARRKAR